MMKNNYSKHSNKIASQLLKVLAITFAVVTLAAGCGQRGTLYLPNTPEATQRSTIGDVLTKPANTPTATKTAPETTPAK